MKFLTPLVILTLLVPLAARADSIALSNRAGLDLMNQVAVLEKNQKNIILSPVSYYLTIAMAYNGTDTQTQQQLLDWLQIQSHVQGFNNDNKAFQKALILAPEPVTEEGAARSPEVGIYNSAWSNTDLSELSGGTFSFKDDYVTELKSSYDAEIAALSFKSTDAAQTINDWAATKTKGLISDIIDADSLKKMFWVLINATYIEAYWEQPFTRVIDPTYTHFTNLSGKTKKIETVERKAHFQALDKDEYSAVEIPFFQSDLALFVVVPKSSAQFNEIQAKTVWHNDFWQTLFVDLAQKEAKEFTHLILPEFTFGFGAEMLDKAPLTRAVGLQFLFEDGADFSAMSKPGSIPTKVGIIKQDAKIALDENGLKAAAVTLIGGIEVTSAEDPLIISADKPFFFAIGSKETGLLLFTGSVVDPTLK